jgi:hypothetical protein
MHAIQFPPEVEAALQEQSRLYEDGMQSGLAGEPDPFPCHNGRRDGWRRGDTLRRIRAGEVLGVLSAGTRCKACSAQNWGNRMGCPAGCGGEIEWGALVDKGGNPSEVAGFVGTGELASSALPLVDAFTGEDVPKP